MLETSKGDNQMSVLGSQWEALQTWNEGTGDYWVPAFFVSFQFSKSLLDCGRKLMADEPAPRIWKTRHHAQVTPQVRVAPGHICLFH